MVLVGSPAYRNMVYGIARLSSLSREKWIKNMMELVLVRVSCLVSGPYEASRVKFTWSQGFQESQKKTKKTEILVIYG